MVMFVGPTLMPDWLFHARTQGEEKKSDILYDDLSSSRNQKQACLYYMALRALRAQGSTLRTF